MLILKCFWRKFFNTTKTKQKEKKINHTGISGISYFDKFLGKYVMIDDRTGNKTILD